jgi:hypothetical protein
VQERKLLKNIGLQSSIHVALLFMGGLHGTYFYCFYFFLMSAPAYRFFLTWSCRSTGSLLSGCMQQINNFITILMTISVLSGKDHTVAGNKGTFLSTVNEYSAEFETPNSNKGSFERVF